MANAQARQGSLIGASLPRTETARLVRGLGRYTDDFAAPRMLHAAFLRSPYAHARIGAIDVAAATACPGVVAVYTAADIATVCGGWRGVSPRFVSLKAPEQRPLAGDTVTYQGEPVALVLAQSRAAAEDALEHILVDWQELPAVLDLAAALAPASPVIHPEIGSNLAFQLEIGGDHAAAIFATAPLVVEQRLHFGRQTGVPLEARGILADWDAGRGMLTVHQSHQVPHQMRAHYADMLNLPMRQVRVICPDVGGAFGIKLHVYSDEVAICAASKIIGRPVKYIADRLESFVSDAHAREHDITGRLALDEQGRMLAYAVDDLHGMGAYSIYPRCGPAEAVGATRMVGSPYRFDAFHGRVRSIFQNKVPAGQYRGVGHPVATALTEALVDKAALRLGIDRLELRRRNYLPQSSERWKSPADVMLFDLSHQACLDKLVRLMDYENLQADCAAHQAAGRLRGIGFAAYVELTATGPEVYGRSRSQVTTLDSISLRLEPSGEVLCQASITDQGQGTATALRQIVAERLGLALEDVVVECGDTAGIAMGGGAWASRGTAIGGEAALGAASRLAASMLDVAARLLQADPAQLALRNGQVVDAASGEARLAVRDLAETVYYRTHELPFDCPAEMVVSHQYRRTRDNFLPTNGIQASYLEVDRETGLVRLLQHWVVEDCGRVINPLLVDEQIRGGVIQGIGHALYETCRYDEAGQFTNATLAEYLVPMAVEMPDIAVGHIETPYGGSELGAKGAGEAGTCAAAAAVLNAVNHALQGLAGPIDTLPMAPEVVLAALAAGREKDV